MKHSLPFEDIKEIYKCLEKIPMVEMKYSVAKTDHEERLLVGEMLEESGDAMLVVNLKRTNRYNKQFVAASNYPKPKECTWFLFVGNQQTNELVAMKRVAFKRFTTKNLAICLPKNFDSERYQLFLMCDSYIGLDQEFTIDFAAINHTIETSQGFEAESNMQPQQNEEVYDSLFSNVFEAFDTLQDNMVTDVVSDDEHRAPRKPRVNIDQEQVYKDIKSGIDNLLDSGDDSDPPNMNDGQLIEKDLDNWF